MITFSQIQFDSFFIKFVSHNNLEVDFNRLTKKIGVSRAQHRIMLIFAGCGIAHKGPNIKLVFKNHGDDVAFKLKYVELFNE